MRFSFDDPVRMLIGLVVRERSHGWRERSPSRGGSRKFVRLVFFVCVLLAGIPSMQAGSAGGLTIAWTNNMLSIYGPNIPGGKVDTWYLEAFCRSGSTHRDWHRTTIPHQTELLSADKGGKRLRLRTTLEPKVEVLHDIRAGKDDVDFRLTLKNHGDQFVDIQWFQPCMRVDRFTGCNQSNYITRSFIFTARGLSPLDKTRRTEEAMYRGGQVYVPEGINLQDVNPRPISSDRPVNGLIGCFCADDRFLLAMAWDRTQELFQGVIVCLHNDPRVGGLNAGQTKKLHGKIYFLKNDPAALLKRYNRDFPKSCRGNVMPASLRCDHWWLKRFGCASAARRSSVVCRHFTLQPFRLGLDHSGTGKMRPLPAQCSKTN